MMRNLMRTALSLAMLSLVSATARGQAVPPGPPGAPPPNNEPRLDFSVAVGSLTSTDWSDLVVLGSVGPVGNVSEQLVTRDVAIKPGRSYDAAVTYWRGRYGFRVHGGWSNSCVSAGGSCGSAGSPGPDSLSFASVDLDTWLYDVGGMVGLVEYRASRPAWPYVFFGLGGITYDLNRPIQPSLSLGTNQGGAITGNNVVILRDSTQFLLAASEATRETSIAFNAGIGADIRIPMHSSGVGLRFEAGDYITRSPLRLRLIPFDSRSTGDTIVDFGWVHNLRVAGGLVVHFGW